METPLVDDASPASDVIVEERANPEPKLYKRRWFQLFLLGMCMVANVVGQSTFASSGTLLLKYYQIPGEIWKINMMTRIYTVTTLPMTLLVSVILKKLGLRWCLILFSVLLTVGSWIRCAAFKGEEYTFWIAFVGQTIAAIGYPFLTLCTDTFGVFWFGNKERTVVQVIIMFSGIFGSIISSLAGTHLMTIGSEEVLAISELGVGIYVLIQAVFATLTAVLIIIFFKSKPPTLPAIVQENSSNSTIPQESAQDANGTEQTPPTKVEEPKDVYPPQTFLFGFKKLMTSPNFFFILIANIGVNSVFSSMMLLEQFLQPNKYTTIDSSNFSIVMIVCATVASIVFSIIFDKVKQKKLLIVISSLSACLGFLWFCILMTWEKNDILLVYTYLSFVIIGTFAVPTIPMVGQMIVYTTYPVHPSTTLTVTSVISNVWNIFYNLIFISLIQTYTDCGPTVILWTDFAILALTFILILIFRGELSPVLTSK